MDKLQNRDIQNKIEQFKEDIEGLPYQDIKEYQEEFKDYLWYEYNIEVLFEADEVIVE